MKESTTTKSSLCYLNLDQTSLNKAHTIWDATLPSTEHCNKLSTKLDSPLDPRRVHYGILPKTSLKTVSSAMVTLKQENIYADEVSSS